MLTKISWAKYNLKLSKLCLPLRILYSFHIDYSHSFIKTNAIAYLLCTSYIMIILFWYPGLLWARLDGSRDPGGTVIVSVAASWPAHISVHSRRALHEAEDALELRATHYFRLDHRWPGMSIWSESLNIGILLLVEVLAIQCVRCTIAKHFEKSTNYVYKPGR